MAERAETHFRVNTAVGQAWLYLPFIAMWFLGGISRQWWGDLEKREPERRA